jgi:LCP family protein required for cell wall assembly
MKNPIKDLKIAIVSLLVVILISISSFAVIIKSNFDESINNDRKISLLINEVGDLKMENQSIKDQLIQKEDYFTEILQKIDEINNDLQNTLSTTLSSEQKKIKSMKDTLQNAINEKEKTISELVQKNQEIKSAIALSPYSSRLLNFLIIGKNQGLTDTLIIASINPDTNKIVLVSVPRDLYHRGRKINELLYNYGIDNLEAALKEITGLKIDRYIVFNFDSFNEVIDSIGGIDVDVTKDLIDYSYPGPNNTYKPITFKKGHYVMNGQTALKYARSRKSTSDFDRSKRQQQIITSIINKANAIGLTNRLDITLRTYQKISGDISTDINLFEAMGYYLNYKDYKMISGNTISTQNYLTSKTSKTGQYILLSKTKTYYPIQKYVHDLINS